MKISISTSYFRSKNQEISCLDAVRMLQKAGFSLIELARPQDRNNANQALFADHGISIWAVHGQLWMDAIDPDPAIRAKAIEREQELMEQTAAYAPCPYVIHYLDRSFNDDDTRYFHDAILQLNEIARKIGFVLAIETVPYKPEQYARFSDTAELAEFVKSYNSENVRICIDLNHANLNEDLNQAIANCSGLINTIHVSDNNGIMEEHLLPGNGSIDFGQAFQALVQNGYTGPLNLEIRPPGEPNEEILEQMMHWAVSMAPLLHQ